MKGTTGSITGHEVDSLNLSGHEDQLFLVLERARPLAGSARHSLASVDRVMIGRGPARTARRVVQGKVRDLVLTVPDERMSLAHARLERRGNTWGLVDLGSRNGSRVGGLSVTDTTLHEGDILELAGTFFRFREGVPTPAASPGDVDLGDLTGLGAAFGTILPDLTARLRDLTRVARSGLTVLLLGESGTGKEVLARAIHAESSRPGNFVAVNCGALPENLVESLLFGHKKGTFSGATCDADGFVRTSSGGTLFLDEIGELPHASQAALLRVLQEREVTPVGAARPVSVDLRVVAATNRDLGAMVATGQFRGDLHARLASFQFDLPPLRDRLDDVGMLIASLLARMSTPPLTIGTSALRRLLMHAWPSNVRELEHCLAVSHVLGGERRLDNVRIIESPTATDGATGAPSSPADEAFRLQLVAQLARHGGNVTRVSKAMGKRRTTVQRWLRRLAIDPRKFGS